MSRRLLYVATLTLAVAVASAGAETIIVTSDSGGTGGPDCTLRDAITAANGDSATGGCPAGAGADTIELPVDATITLAGVDNNTAGPNGLPVILSEIIINGNGVTIERSSAGGTPEFRILLAFGGDLTLDDLTVTGGIVNGGGGGIAIISSHLTMTNCTVSGNSAVFQGGGISIGGAATLTNCTVSGNSAGTGGGILHASSNNPLPLTNCTISDNTADLGGGIFNQQGLVTLTNCTVSGNSAAVDGAGIFNSFNGTLTLTSSIVANNTISDDCFNFDGGTILDNGYNIVEDGTCISAPTSSNGDPMLGPLQDNGGPTQTHALLEKSPAIDAIPVVDCAVDTDQRGVLRPQGDGCDIGSYEVELADPCADDDGDGRVTICHVPPGNLSNARTIIVNVNAVPRHLAHGDHCGPCE